MTVLFNKDRLRKLRAVGERTFQGRETSQCGIYIESRQVAAVAGGDGEGDG